jgi:hypothetical protein
VLFRSVGGEYGNGIAATGLIRSAMPANIKSDYLEMLREKRDLVFPILGA